MNEIMAVSIRMLLYPRIAIEFQPRYRNPTAQLPAETREVHHWELDKYCFEETRANPESCPNNIVWTAIWKNYRELVRSIVVHCF
jgi:hypothetical protein